MESYLHAWNNLTHLLTKQDFDREEATQSFNTEPHRLLRSQRMKYDESPPHSNQRHNIHTPSHRDTLLKYAEDPLTRDYKNIDLVGRKQ